MLYKNTFYVDEKSINERGVIYLLIFDSGKVYIGQTKQKLSERLRTHCTTHQRKALRNTKLYKALSKYKTCSCHVLMSGLSVNLLNKKEIVFIELFDSLNNGYNSMSGGRNLRTDINWRHRKKKLTKEHRLKIGLSLRKKVINLDTGEIFGSCTDAALSVNGEQRKLAINLKYGFRYKGYRFCFFDKRDSFVFKSKQKKEVINVQTGIKYSSITDAGKSVNKTLVDIQSALRTGCRCGGYNWKRI